MKQVYQLFAAATIVVVGATNLAARNWTPSTSAVPAAEVKAGQTYALQGLSATNSDKRRFLQGEAFVEKNFVSTDGVFEFEPVAGLENVFFLKVHGRTTNQYVANPGSNNFYTSSKNRAWKVLVMRKKHMSIRGLRKMQLELTQLSRSRECVLGFKSLLMQALKILK